MKSSELQLGDWVKISCEDDESIMYAKITAIREYSVETDGTGIDPCFTDSHTYGNEVFPIPLTAKILENNGWVLNLSNDRYQQSIPFKHIVCGMTETFYYYVELEYEQSCESWIMNVSDYFKCWVDNVHEFQHALSLAGINKNIEL